MKPRCLILFEESCRSKQTLKTYQVLLNKFLRWSQKDHESLLLLTKPELTELLQDYVIHLKKRISPNSIIGNMSSIFKFLDVNEREYNKKKIAMLYPEKVKLTGERAITESELQELIIFSPGKKGSAIIHVLASTGCRPEGLAELQIKDIEPIEDCISLKIYSGSKNEYYAFLHQEATEALKKYHEEREKLGEKLLPESFVFRKNRFIVNQKNPEPLNSSSIGSYMRKAMKRGNIKRVKEGHRYDLAVCIGIRKRFNTVLKRNPKISYATSEMLMDHKVRYEGHYNKPTREELFEEFKKAIPELTISITSKQKAKIEKQKQKIDDLERKEDEIDDLKLGMKRLKAKVKRIEKINKI